jgi:two-component system, OmpR family, phosphate regulon response regulator OmpR
MHEPHTAHILFVDDDKRIRELLARFLSENGYRVTTAENASTARQHLSFDLLILDVMMPGESGFDLARFIRQSSIVPILFLTARADVNDRLLGLEIGGDDYMSKPFDPRELLLRLSNILKNNPPLPAAPTLTRWGEGWAFDHSAQTLTFKGTPLALTGSDIKLLQQLLSAQGRIISRSALAAHLGIAERSVDTHITRLRTKLSVHEGAPSSLETIRGHGFRLRFGNT